MPTPDPIPTPDPVAAPDPMPVADLAPEPGPAPALADRPVGAPLVPPIPPVSSPAEPAPLAAAPIAPDQEDVDPAGSLSESAPQPPQRRSGADAATSGYLVLSGRGADARRGLTDAVAALRAAAGIDVADVSPLARLVSGAGDLHSAVVSIQTTLSPGELASAVAAVGQPDVTVEVLTLDDMVGEFDGVELPLPGAATSAAVLTPWSQLAPAAVLPGLGGGPVAVLAETAPDRGAVKWLALDWLE